MCCCGDTRKPREFWIKGLTVYQSEPANIGKVLHVIEYSAYEQAQFENDLVNQGFKDTAERNAVLRTELEALRKERDELELALECVSGAHQVSDIIKERDALRAENQVYRAALEVVKKFGPFSHYEDCATTQTDDEPCNCGVEVIESRLEEVLAKYPRDEA